MENNYKTTDKIIVKTPLEHGLKTIDDLMHQNKQILLSQNFLSSHTLYLDDEFLKPKQNKFLMELWNKVYSIQFVKTKKENDNDLINIRMVTNFVVLNARKVVKIFNNKSGIRNLTYYAVDLLSDTSCLVKDIEIKDNAKNDYKEFQRVLSSQENSFITNLKEDEFKEFIRIFVLPKIDKTIYLYSNSGIITPQIFIYKNALVDRGNIHWADKNSYINTSNDKTLIKVDDELTFPLPTLYTSKKSGKEIAAEFIKNMNDCWGDYSTQALLITGHMCMGIYYELFSKNIGAPTLLISGLSGTGKSTLVQNGLAIFGLKSSFLTAGNSTPKSHEFMASSFNGMNVCSDDIQDSVLTSPNFNSLIKSAFHGLTRTKLRNYGKNIDSKPICSQLIFSTNYALPELPELQNRTNVFSLTKTYLDLEQFNYLNKHVKNREELSLILPEFLKFTEEEVLNLHRQLCKFIEENIEKVESRIISNIAYAYTGVKLLEKISGIEIESLNAGVIDYAKSIAEKYKAIPTPVDRLLNDIIVLKNNKAIVQGTHYKIIGANKTKNGTTLIAFHKDTLLTAHNQYFKFDDNRKIDPISFNSYLKEDKRFVKAQSARFDDSNKPKESIYLDITDMPELESLGGLYAMSAENLRTNNHL